MTLTARDQARRAKAIGSSEAHKIVLRTAPHDVFLRLVHPELLVPEDLESSMLARRGHVLEPFAAELYAERTGLELVKSRTLRHPRHRFIVATPDRVVFGDGVHAVGDRKPVRNVQFKAVSWRAFKRDGWGDEGTDAFPLRFRVQVTLEAAVLGGVPSDLVALVDGETQVRIYPVPFDAELAGLIESELEAFWRNHVLTRDPPPPDGSAAAAAYLAKRYPENKGNVLPATIDDEKLANELREIRRQVKLLEARATELENVAKARTGDADGVEKQWTWKLPSTGRGRVSWQSVAEEERHENGLLRMRLAKLEGHEPEDLRDTWPEIVARHTSKPSRAFRLMGTKEETTT